MFLFVIPLVLLCQFVFIFQQSSLSLLYFDKQAEKKEQFVFNFTQTGPHRSFIYVRMIVLEPFANNWLPLPYLGKTTRMLSIFMFLLGHSTICQLPLNDNGYHLYVSAFHFFFIWSTWVYADMCLQPQFMLLISKWWHSIRMQTKIRLGFISGVACINKTITHHCCANHACICVLYTTRVFLHL